MGTIQLCLYLHLHTLQTTSLPIHAHTFCPYSLFCANQNQSPPAGHETLAFSVGGRSADLNRGGRTPTFLTTKKGVLSGHNTAITGLCIIVPTKVRRARRGGEGLENVNERIPTFLLPVLHLSIPLSDRGRSHLQATRFSTWASTRGS